MWYIIHIMTDLTQPLRSLFRRRLGNNKTRWMYCVRNWRSRFALLRLSLGILGRESRHHLAAELTSLRSSFPWSPRHSEHKHCQWQYKTKRERCLSKLNSFSFSFCTCGAACAHSALVIPAVEAVWLVYLKHSKRCAIFAVYPYTTLTLMQKSQCG